MNERVSEALALLRGAIKKRPDDISLRQKLFDATVQAGLFDEAVQAFTELVQIQPVYLDEDANVLIHGGPNPPDDPITGMIKAKAKIPSRTGSEPTRYAHSYLCTFKRQMES